MKLPRGEKTVRIAAALSVAVGATGTGCALLSKAEPVDVHWYTPESPAGRPRLTSFAERRSPSRHPCAIELGRVTSSTHLRERMVVRRSPNELTFEESRRWAERPVAYVRRAIDEALFETHGLRRAGGGDVPVLDVDVTAFEELRTVAPAQARVVIRVHVEDDSGVLTEDTLTESTDVASNEDEGAAVAAAMGDALGAVTEDAAKRVLAVLRERAGCGRDRPAGR